MQPACAPAPARACCPRLRCAGCSKGMPPGAASVSTVARQTNSNLNVETSNGPSPDHFVLPSGGFYYYSKNPTRSHDDGQDP